MVVDSLNLKLRQIARFSSNVNFDEMSSAKCRRQEERPLYDIHMVTSLFHLDSLSLDNIMCQQTLADYYLLLLFSVIKSICNNYSKWLEYC